ncbi:MAG: L,D-transpeptidase [Hyphomicrobiaceae bacterium]
MHTRSTAASQAMLKLGELRLRCAIGRAGIVARKREGDSATPAGTWRLLEVLWRRDRGRRPICRLPVRAIRTDDGWCDAPGDRNYNRPVRHPYAASAERLWRDDHLYDVVVVLDHNRSPRVRGRGSAIFMHVARPAYEPTEGCIALAEQDLRRLLIHLGRGARIVIRR